MPKCPFKLATSGPPAGSLNIMDYGAHADGATTDCDHLATALEASTAAEKTLYLPAGSYYLPDTTYLGTNAKLYGAGIGVTIIVTGASAGGTTFSAPGPASGVSIKHMTIDGPTYHFVGDGLTSPTFDHVYSDGGNIAWKIGVVEGGVTTGLSMVSVTTHQSVQGAYFSMTENSTFSNCVFDAALGESTSHGIYLHYDCHNLAFAGCTFSGGGGYSLHLCPEGEEAGSDYATFTNCIVDARAGRYCFVAGIGWGNVTLTNTTFLGQVSEPDEICRFYYTPDAPFLFDGFTATGEDTLVRWEYGIPETTIEFKNGTFDGSEKCPSGQEDDFTFTNVTLV